MILYGVVSYTRDQPGYARLRPSRHAAVSSVKSNYHTYRARPTPRVVTTSHYHRQPFQAGPRYNSPFMAGPMQSSKDPVAISNPLPGNSTSILTNPPDPLSYLKHSTSKPESHLSSIASAGLRTSPSPGLSNHQRQTSPRMASTTAAAGPAERPLDQEKETDQSRSQAPKDAPAPGDKSHESTYSSHTVNESMDSASKPMHVPSEDMQVDPQSNVQDTFGTGDGQNTLMNNATVASPGPIEDSASQDGDRPHHRGEADIREEANKAFSYPMPAAGLSDPRRGLSLPHSGFHRGSPRSPSAKKHRCPYCATEFTRHHNLKSHLLTHSQEKPYVCQTCQSRFRRLHDLKRHTKLHTGERPHICPKCGRRFARGDALARHNKGQGGCAGRRSSMGSYGGEEEYGEGHPGGPEDAMDGLMYTAEPERMDEEDERRLSIPGIKKYDAPSDSLPRSTVPPASYQARQPSTYPPIAAGRPSPGGLFPPPPSHGGSSSSTSPISQSGNMTFPPPGQHSGAVFPPSSITESPKPLSPNAMSSHQLGHGPEAMHLHRPHSPGPAQPYQQQQQHYRAPTQPPPTTLGLPPPQPGAPQLPLPPGLTPPDARYTLHSQAPVQPPSSIPSKHAPTQSHSSNHGAPAAKEPVQNSGSSYPGIHDTNGGDQSREDLWAYIRSVHEEVAGLKAEVAALRAQISANSNATTSSTMVRPQQVQGEGVGGSNQR
ncbi:hypothetical protein DTO271D3_6428 [Paecilomyces variotii]|nr:hypothetical protein DTO271D3_6428 [Paecilomyces variotii]KAJ9338990.1 hypothetical protein DTO027B6_8469 [Paecilomyces variotii]KAJ9387620.1 hypothetical protein DTO063F5_3184 [Paecilomyces variotii]KAJ9411107.1 hypothetical protein DTO045G8_1428 [Paecilomyces variotii]